MGWYQRGAFGAAAALALAAGAGTAARAELVLSQTIVDLMPGKPPREDVEVHNAGSERMYVLAEPFEILAPGSPDERREPAGRAEGSPSLLVSPQRVVLEPGERRVIRIGFVGERPSSDRVFRVAIRPVAGALSAEASALKVFVGYDALVLVRPTALSGDISAAREGRALVLRNSGNTAQELFAGEQCAAGGQQCQALPSRRLYPGASWRVELPYDTEVRFKTAIGPKVVERRF